MTVLTVFRNTLRLNSSVINQLQNDIMMLKQEAQAWRTAGEKAYFVEACQDVRKLRSKLAKAIELQKRVKAEIAAVFRDARIMSKFTKVFGRAPLRESVTSIEQEAMLDFLLAEKAESEASEKLAQTA